MRIFALLLTCASLGTALMHAQSLLAAYLDKNRILLVFAPTDTDARLQQQLTLLKRHAAGLKERDVLVLPLLVNSSNQTGATLRTLLSATPTPDEQGTLRMRFHIQPADFAVILVGKDGGEKLRQQTPISPAKLNSTIDAMPMRQDEMQQSRTHPEK